jgi:hypothetical protein
MPRYKILLFFQCLILLIPLNIFMWGDWMLIDLQWALVRYQFSSVGTSIILGYKDILYILLGLNTGIYNILAATFWTIGSILLILALVLTLIAWINEQSGLIRTASFCILGGGVMFSLSALGRFTGGFSIPIGVPVILLIGWWMYRQEPEYDDEEGVPDDGERSANE